MCWPLQWLLPVPQLPVGLTPVLSCCWLIGTLRIEKFELTAQRLEAREVALAEHKKVAVAALECIASSCRFGGLSVGDVRGGRRIIDDDRSARDLEDGDCVICARLG